MNDFSVLFVSWKCMLLKKNSPRAEHLTFAPFFYFLIYLQVWLRSRLGEVSLLRSALSFFFFFFTWDWSPPALRSILTRSPCFVSWKFLILLMQTEMLSSAVQHSLGSGAWAGHLSPFFFFFLKTSPRSWKKGQRNPLNPWMDSHQRHMRLWERHRDTGGWGDVLAVVSRSCWNEIMRNRISEEIRSRL